MSDRPSETRLTERIQIDPEDIIPLSWHRLGTLLLYFPLWYVPFAGLMFNIPAEAFWKIVFSLKFFALLSSMAGLGLGLRHMKRWSWPLVWLSMALLFWQQLDFFWVYSESHHKVFVFFWVSLFQLLFLWFTLSRIRVPYLYPRIRWWENHPKFRIEMKAHLVQQGSTLQGRILDVSSSGCFLKTREVIPVGTPVQIGFEAFQSRFELTADVVWCAQMAVVHPQGLGLRFRNVPTHERKRLKKLEKKLKRMHAFYRRFRVLLSHQEFQAGWDAFLKQPLESEVKKP